MRLNNGALWIVCITLAAVWPLPPVRGQQESPIRPKLGAAPPETDEQSAADGPKPPEGDAQAASDTAANADGKDTRLTLEDIQSQRRRRISPERIAEDVAERGRGFEITADITGKLLSLGFRPTQIDTIKNSSDEPLAPGKWLTTSDERRNQSLKEMKQVAVKSGAAIAPIESQHVTLWAAEETQRTYLPDVKRLENFFHTKCAEPIRSGLDKRSTHVVLLKDHAEYEAWWGAMLGLFGGKRFDKKDLPQVNAHFREEILKTQFFYSWDFCVISLGEAPDSVHRQVAGGVGEMYFSQLVWPRGSSFRPLQTGFINEAETAVFGGSPSVMFSTIVYGLQTRHLSGDQQAWSLLVRQRVTTHKATPVGELLQMDASTMLQPHYAEGWTLVGLLSKQRAKFGKLLLAIRKGTSELEAIEKVYGWDEKKLTKEWYAYVMGLRNKSVRRGD
jgi:hypothetical protein